MKYTEEWLNFAQLCSQDIGSAISPSPTVGINRLGSGFLEPLNTGDALDRYQHVWQKVIVEHWEITVMNPIVSYRNGVIYASMLGTIVNLEMK